MAFAPISRGSALPLPAQGRMSNDAAGFASCYGPHRRSPIRAFDAGLRPRPFPGETASLLPGLLAATRTGLTPAGNNKLMSDQVISTNHLQPLEHCASEGTTERDARKDSIVV